MRLRHLSERLRTDDNAPIALFPRHVVRPAFEPAVCCWLDGVCEASTHRSIAASAFVQSTSLGPPPVQSSSRGEPFYTVGKRWRHATAPCTLHPATATPLDWAAFLGYVAERLRRPNSIRRPYVVVRGRCTCAMCRWYSPFCTFQGLYFSFAQYIRRDRGFLEGFPL